MVIEFAVFVKTLSKAKRAQQFFHTLYNSLCSQAFGKVPQPVKQLEKIEKLKTNENKFVKPKWQNFQVNYVEWAFSGRLFRYMLGLQMRRMCVCGCCCIAIRHLCELNIFSHFYFYTCLIY